MKRSIVSYKSYCQLLRLWSHHSARLGSSVYSCCGENSRTLLASSSHQNRISAVRALCTTTEDVDSEEGYDDDEDNVEFIVPTVPVFHKENFSAKIRTQHDDPTKHTVEDYGMYYRLSQGDYEKFIKDEQWPGYKKMVKTFQEAVMMVRKPALEAFKIIDNANYDYPPLRLFFYGKVGSGKSMSLSHVVHRCSKQGMLVIHLQSMSHMIRDIRTVVRPHAVSDYTEGKIDLIDDAMNWLIHFKLQNEELLKQLSIKTTKEYVWSIRESAKIGTDLLDLIEFGIDRKRYASDCIGAIFREIKKVASEKRVKVLVAVEGVNGLWKITNVRDDEMQRISAQNVTTFQHFQKLFEPNWTNGICVGTVCPSIEALDNTMYKNKMDVPYTPQYLLKKEGFDFMDPFVPILVPEFNYKEAHNCIDYYIDRKWINKPKSLTEAGRKELMMLSNMNPYQMMTLSSRF